jgi:hypothetical protein
MRQCASLNINFAVEIKRNQRMKNSNSKYKTIKNMEKKKRTMTPKTDTTSAKLPGPFDFAS